MERYRQTGGKPLRHPGSSRPRHRPSTGLSETSEADQIPRRILDSNNFQRLYLLQSFSWNRFLIVTPCASGRNICRNLASAQAMGRDSGRVARSFKRKSPASLELPTLVEAPRTFNDCISPRASSIGASFHIDCGKPDYGKECLNRLSSSMMLCIQVFHGY